MEAVQSLELEDQEDVSWYGMTVQNDRLWLIMKTKDMVCVKLGIPSYFIYVICLQWYYLSFV